MSTAQDDRQNRLEILEGLVRANTAKTCELLASQKTVAILSKRTARELASAERRQKYLQRLEPWRRRLLDWSGTRWIGVFIFFVVAIGITPLAYAAHTLLGVLAALIGLWGCVAMVYPASEQLPNRCEQTSQTITAARETRDMLRDQNRTLRDQLWQCSDELAKLLLEITTLKSTSADKKN
jgi:hypothetical protein